METKMRVFEAQDDRQFMPGIPLVARIDGRSFTRLTKEVVKFDAPFDERFSELMVSTTRHLCDAGFQVVYGYTQSDEISLLCRVEDGTFQRKARKWNSVLASEAGACFSLGLGRIASFDCRVIPLPGMDEVVQYFAWRQEDASRNALNAHCYWLLRRQGASVNGATDRLRGISVSAKHDLLFEGGINFDQLPAWQKRGVGVYWNAFPKEGLNPITNELVTVSRKQLITNRDLPAKAAYEAFLMERMA